MLVKFMEVFIMKNSKRAAAFISAAVITAVCTCGNILGAVACISFFVYDYQFEPVILCILYAFMSSTVSDKLTKDGRSAVRFEIITDYPEEISSAIIHELHHSATLIPGRGMYLDREVSMLLCVVNKSQITRLTNICRRYPNTFAIIDPVSEVMGNFKKIDTRGREETELLDSADGKAV